MNSIYPINSTLNHVNLGRAVTFIKYLASVICLMFVPKTLIWDKIKFSASNLLNFAELIKNELMKSISKKIYQYSFLISNLSLLIVKILRAYN